SLKTLIEVALSVAPLTLADYEARQRHCEESNDMRPHSPTSDDHGHDHGDDELAKRMRNLMLGGSVLLGFLVKRLITGPGALAANPVLFGISAVATIISGYPFLRGALRSLSRGGSMTTDTLVSSATIASIIMRESVTALVVISLLNLGEYLQALVLRRTR